MVLWIFPAAIVAALLGTAVLRRYALSRQIMDVPNARSSHTVPTPRGGGLAIVLVFLLALLVFERSDLISAGELIGLLGSGLFVALIGFVDDHQHVPARWRILGHIVAAFWGAFWLNGLPPLDLGFLYLTPGLLAQAIAVLYLVWLLNLYNFMDGIDGIAGAEAVCVTFSGVLLYVLSGNQDVVWLPALLGCTVLGFLFWNMPPARIFMGDVGSGFLGIILGLMSIQAGWAKPELFWSWLILLGIFIVDATWTLFRRLFRGDRIYEAHRSHAYQWASRYFASHRVVTLSVIAINILWLLPCAFLVTLGYVSGLLGLTIAYIPLLILAISFKAGIKEVRS
ncbi:glycosyl transferase [Pseudomonas asuensis]|uniref:Glycosyl transferase n=1 Tax=Pseudomonas asuensis TaxID=1825787 RepID=A0ABQ2GMZ9_9PSED|nr:glycosyltransferase family 4 protein [Pseudomonas asuensis]GGM03148.1 glycosyl transferase [Pseudomonas asuensis]